MSLDSLAAKGRRLEEAEENRLGARTLQSRFGGGADNPDSEIVMGRQLAGETSVLRELVLGQKEDLVLSEVVDHSLFDLDETEATGPVPSTARTYWNACCVEDFAHGRTRGKSNLARSVGGKES